MERETTFFSDGIKLAATLYLPDGLRKNEKRPAILLCHGYTGIRRGLAATFAQRFCAAGYVALTFDYRGFGDSGGQKWRLIPLEQVRDIRNALTFVSLQQQVDPARVGLFGASFGGANVCYTAGIDDRPKCVVSVVGIGDGRRWLRSLRRKWEWEEFLKRLEQDRAQRVTTGKSTYIDPDEIMLCDPESAQWRIEMGKAYPEMGCQVPLETGERIIEYQPESVVGNIAPRPLLLIHAGRDNLVPVDESQSLYMKAGEPKKLVIIEGIAHHEVYKSEYFERVVTESLDWFGRYLPVAH